MTSKRYLLEICDSDTADKILAMIAENLDPREVSESCDAWVRQCYHDPPHDAQVLHAANELLEMHGVEGWPASHSDLRLGVSYCNTGDLYARTLALVPDGRWGGHKFTVTSFEALANRFPNRQM